jgi:lipopolysaccharide O-acetyltransferase
MFQMGKIKENLRKSLSNYLRLKEKAKYNTQNPFGVFIGKNSFFEEPMQIDGGKYIKIGNQSSVGQGAWLGAIDKYNSQKFTPSLSIGNNVRIGNFACITCIDEIIIEDGCLFSEYAYISDHFHGFDPSIGVEPARQPLFSKGKVKIGKDSFIGYRATILSGVSLGKNCVVGAHSVVTKSFPDYSMVAGVPAKLIKKYSFDQNKWINIK